MTGKAAEREAKKQGKKLLNSGDGTDFINEFPGENLKEKVFTYSTLLNLQKSGYWYTNHQEWKFVGNVGFATLTGLSRKGTVLGVRWEADEAYTLRSDQMYPKPVVAFEDC